MKYLVQSILIMCLLTGAFGCADKAAQKAAEDARVAAADALVATAAAATARAEAAEAALLAATTARAEAAEAANVVAATNAQTAAAASDARVAAAARNARLAAPKDAADAVPSARTNNADGDAPPRTVFTPAARARHVIPSGTVLKVTLLDTLDSKTSAAGDRFMASLSESIVVNGATLLQKGANVSGRVVDVKGAGRTKGLASIHLELTEVVQGNQTIPLTTDSLPGVAASTKKRDLLIIAAATALGAAAGGVANGGKGAALGAAAGGGGGTGVILATKGKEIHYPPETRLTFTLTKAAEM